MQSSTWVGIYPMGYTPVSSPAGGSETAGGLRVEDRRIKERSPWKR